MESVANSPFPSFSSRLHSPRFLDHCHERKKHRDLRHTNEFAERKRRNLGYTENANNNTENKLSFQTNTVPVVYFPNMSFHFLRLVSDFQHFQYILSLQFPREKIASAASLRRERRMWNFVESNRRSSFLSNDEGTNRVERLTIRRPREPLNAVATFSGIHENRE